MANIIIEPILRMDFNSGLLRNVSDTKRPSNAVPFAVNFIFDENIGEATLRKGTSMISTQVVNNKSVLGLVNLRRRGDTNHRLLVAINDSSDTNSDIFKLN